MSPRNAARAPEFRPAMPHLPAPATPPPPALATPRAPPSSALASRALLRGVLGVAAFAAATGLGPEPARASQADPFTKGPYVQDLGATTAEVRVEVDPPAPVSLELGDADAPGRLVHKEAAAFHVFPLSGLTPRTRYRYAARSGAATKSASFTTALANDAGDAVTFLVYGDNRTDDDAHVAVVRAMSARPADFLLNTGDLVEHGGLPGLWQRFFDMEAPLLASECVFATVGNHELADREASLYLRYFGPGASSLPPSEGGPAPRPELHRTFRWGYLRFFTLSGMGADLASDKRWLEEELGRSDKEAGLAFRIVMLHHGPWSSGPHGRNGKLHDTGIVELLRAHHVSLVLSGHDHIYERGQADGLPYMVSGGGGAPSYDLKQRLPYSRAFEPARHFVEVRATPKAMTFTATRVDGSRIEECALPSDGTGWACDATTKVASEPAAAGGAGGGGGTGGASTPASSNGAAKPSCACRAAPVDTASGAGAAGALSFLGLFLLGARRYARRRCAPPWSSP